ncbi:MAG: HD domain-containing protein [Spirochaetes bacterium]|nr:HD domain-containing protein [Spirochaetota bacterium]
MSQNNPYYRNYQIMKKKFLALSKMHRQNQIAYKKLYKSYILQKRKFLILKKLATTKMTSILDQYHEKKYQMIFNHNRKLLNISEEFLEEIDMTKEEFEKSFYIDVLFEKYLPIINTKEIKTEIESFQFPILMKNYEFEDVHIHPYYYYEIYGKIEYDKRKRQFFYFLHLENISDTVELNYIQKTDTVIKSLSISNINLMKANKTIEIHKIMLIQITCSLIQEYNQETSEHLNRIQQITTLLTAECKRLGLIDIEEYDINDYIKDVNYISVLHDIGKITIPHDILTKKDKFTPAEYDIMKTHTTKGAAFIQKIIDFVKLNENYHEDINFLQIPYHICLYHHERWDGKGYPEGLKENKIPFCARIVAVADTFDAIRGKRVYDKSRPHHEAVNIIREERGKQFDPNIVDAFLNIESLLSEIEYETPDIDN